MKWMGVLLFAVLLVSLAVAPRLYAQSFDPNDNFDDGVIDTGTISTAALVIIGVAVVGAIFYPAFKELGRRRD